MATVHHPPVDPLDEQPKQVRRPKFHHNPALARPYPLERLLTHPAAIPALVLLDRHALLTNEMLQDLLFRDHRDPTHDARLKDPEAAMKRTANRLIIRLKDAELIERRLVWMESAHGFPYPYPVNQLTAQGANLLKRVYAEHGGTVRWRPSLTSLTDRGARHALEINRFFVALQRASWVKDVTVHHWRDDRQLAAMDRGETLFDNVPDAFFILEAGGQQYSFFLEIDRGFETVASLLGDPGDWTTKIERYQRFLTAGYARAPYFATLPEPLILTVTTSAARVVSLLAATRTVAPDGPYWMTHQAALYADKAADALWRPVWERVDGRTHSLWEWVS